MNANVNLAAWRERLLSPLGWHLAAFALLLATTIWLGVRFGLDWTATHGHSSDELAGKLVQLRALDQETAPLRGLDKRVEQAHVELKNFYSKRIPLNYSAISSRIGELGVKSGVRLTRVQYTQGKPGSVLTEISMDAAISGDKSELIYETADLWFHTLVMLAHLDLHPQQVLDELARRFNVSGHTEKASRDS